MFRYIRPKSDWMGQELPHKIYLHRTINNAWKYAYRDQEGGGTKCNMKNSTSMPAEKHNLKKKNYYKIKDIHNAGWFYVTKETNFLRNLLSFECKGNLTRIYFKMFEFPQKA